MSEQTPNSPEPDDPTTPSEIVHEVAEALPIDLKPEDRVKVLETVQTVVESSYHSGPLPSAAQLREYEDVLPGAADRIIRMAENQVAHRQTIESEIVHAGIEDQKQERAERRIGQIFGLLIGLFVIGCGTFSVIKGFPISGTTLGASGVVGLVSVFVIGRRTESQDHEGEETDHTKKMSEREEVEIDSDSLPDGNQKVG